MYSFVTLDYMLYVFIFVVLTAYFTLFIIKHKVEDHIPLFILVIIVMVILFIIILLLSYVTLNICDVVYHTNSNTIYGYIISGTITLLELIMIFLLLLN